MKNLTETESMIRERLEELKPVPSRNPQVAARARARFLAQVAAARESRRSYSWGWIFGRPQFALNALVSVLVIVGLFVGGGTTVRAAQDDLPNEPLYAVKTWSEDVRLQFENNPEAKVERLMELSQTRVQEMTRLVESGQAVPERVSLRLEQHLQQSLQLCSTMDDATLDRTLTQVRDQLQKQERDLQALQAQAGQGTQPVLEHTRAFVQAQLHVVNDGLLDHQAFRDAVEHGFQNDPTETPTAAVFPTPEPELNGQATPPADKPGNGNGLGPSHNPGGSNAHVTPTPKIKETQQPKETQETKRTKEPKTKDPKVKEPNDHKPDK